MHSQSPGKALVLGGTRFFGRRLVLELLERQWSVTIGTRGLSADPFASEQKGRVKRIILDRTRPDSLREALASGDSGEWDVVFDQIAYTPFEAAALCECLKDRAGRLVFTSTQSVYERPGNQLETDFDPSRAKFDAALGYDKSGARSLDYPEGKRQAEAAFYALAPCPLACVRIPYVLGPDDYTRRLEFHVERIRSGRPFYAGATESRFSVIHADEAGRFLAWVGTDLPADAICRRSALNAASRGSVTLSGLIRDLEAILKRRAVLLDDDMDGERSPYATEQTTELDTNRASALGFQFSRTEDWLPSLIRQACAQISNG